MRHQIIGFHQDALGDWVAELVCGHRQHMRHNPPWVTRPWVLSAEGRQEKLGVTVECKECDRAERKLLTHPLGEIA